MTQVLLLEKDQLSSLIAEAVKDGYNMARSTLGDGAQDFPPNMRDNQAAKYLGIKAPTLRRWRMEGRGPRFTKQGRSITYSRKDLDAYLQANKVLIHA